MKRKIKTIFKRFLNQIALVLVMGFSVTSVSAQEFFEFVVIPDTQTYMEEYPEIYLDQMEWVAENQDRFEFALHVGDITQSNSEEEWEMAKKGFAILDNKVPYSFSLGNHDMGSEPGKFADTRNTSLANKYFSADEISNVIASFPESTVDNLASSITKNDQKWLVLALEFGPRNKTIDWAEDLIKNHPNHKVIIVTHAYLFEDDTLHDGEDWWLPQNYGIGEDEDDEAPNDGGQLWEKLVSRHENIKMVFSGHILKSGVGTLVNKGEKGNEVYQMLANYQKGVEGSENGGNGFLRIIKVDPAAQRIEVTTYSPWLKEFKEESAHQFSFDNVMLKEFQ